MSPSAPLSIVGETLDGLGVALCAFDEEDRTLAWNRTFLDLFPEHANDIRAGEPYVENLRRFYRGRLNDDEMPSIDRYVEEGLARHRAQGRPYAFDHRGFRLAVSSLPIPGVGRVRMWKPERELAVNAMTSTNLNSVDARNKHLPNGNDFFDSIADGVVVTRPDGVIRWVNRAFVLMYGISNRAAAVGQRFADVYLAAWYETGPVEDFDHVSEHANVMERLRFAGVPFEVKLPGDRWVRVLDQRAADGSGLLTHVDISVFKQQKRRLIEAERRASATRALLEATLDRMEQGIMMVDAEGIVQVFNRRVVELLGLPAELMASAPKFSEVVAFQWASHEFEGATEELREDARLGRMLDRRQIYDRERPNGQVLEVHSVPIAGGGVLRTYTDITQRKKSEERIRFVSRHDGLTSLVNREVFSEHLAGACNRCKRGGGHFAVHFIDLDRFKPVNDQFGHAIGDQVLRLVADRLRQIARESDVIARLGGDEFAVLQRQIEQRSDAEGFADRILQALAQVMNIEGRTIRIGASVGIALFPSSGEDPDTLLRSADAAMYEAKASGRDSFRTFTSPGS